jgi:hypothetical protein
MNEEAQLKKPGWPRLWVPIFICCIVYSLTLPFAHGADKPDKREVIKQARHAYYSLADRGLTGFQSNLQPNWRLNLKDLIASDPANAEAAVKLLNGIHFMLSLGPDGVVKVTHRADVAPPNEKAAEGFNQIYAGMEQAMSGFFDTWKPFMLDTPFPVNGDYRLEELDNQYHLSYKDGTADVATTMSKELLISEIKMDDPAFKSVIKPVFTTSSQGFLLTGYDATSHGTSGNDETRLKVQIDYQQVNGFQLLNKLNLSGAYQGTPFEVEVTFSEYEVKTR